MFFRPMAWNNFPAFGPFLTQLRPIFRDMLPRVAGGSLPHPGGEKGVFAGALATLALPIKSG
jgi:hypothetical protein